MATVDRKLLQQALKQGQDISRRATTGEGFDPRGGLGVLGLQLATAGIGAFAQNRAKKQLAEQEQKEQQAFGQQFPQFAGLAGQLSPETRQAALQAQLTGQIKQQFQAAPTPLSPGGKITADIKAGFLPEGTSLKKPEDLTKKRELAFKQTRDLRKEFTKNSGEFIKQRDAFSRIQASVEDPSAAGDLALIFNFMKLLDPGSTVREGEFATAQNSAGVPDIIRAKLNSVIDGERLAEAQRADFTTRSNKLFKKAKGIQSRRIKQFEGIATRNNLPVEDVLLDFVGGIDDPQQKQDVIESITATDEQPETQAPTQDKDAALAELKRRGRI